jgi:hypothetical protein
MSFRQRAPRKGCDDATLLAVLTLPPVPAFIVRTIREADILQGMPTDQPC